MNSSRNELKKKQMGQYYIVWLHYIFSSMIKWNDITVKSCFNACLLEAECVQIRLFWGLWNRREWPTAEALWLLHRKPAWNDSSDFTSRSSGFKWRCTRQQIPDFPSFAWDTSYGVLNLVRLGAPGGVVCKDWDGACGCCMRTAADNLNQQAYCCGS